jgi:hypothetical protein
VREDHGLCAEGFDIDLQQIKTRAGQRLDVLSWFVTGRDKVMLCRRGKLGDAGRESRHVEKDDDGEECTNIEWTPTFQAESQSTKIEPDPSESAARAKQWAP